MNTTVARLQAELGEAQYDLDQTTTVAPGPGYVTQMRHDVRAADCRASRDIQERLMQKSGLTLHAIASQEHVTPGYVSRLLRLSSLAPDIITAIVNGKNPPQVTAKKSTRLALEIPVDWTAQRKLLGFHAR